MSLIVSLLYLKSLQVAVKLHNKYVSVQWLRAFISYLSSRKGEEHLSRFPRGKTETNVYGVYLEPSVP